MPSTQKQIASFRSLSDGIIASAILAQQDDRPIIEKRELSLTLKRVAPCLGIKATAYHILDILLGLVQPDDFQEGRTPIVAISNQRLAEYTLHSTRTVTRCLKQLVEAGILAYKDSPTGRRYINRDRAGRPIQAYGLDFTPSCFNLAAFKNKADAFQHELNKQREAKRTVTRLARAILDLAEFENQRFALLIRQAQTICDDREADWPTRACQMSAVYEQALVLSGRKVEQKELKMSPVGDMDVVTIFNTSIPDSIISNNKMRTCSNEQDLNIPQSGQAAQMALREKPRRQITQDQHKFEKNERAGEQKTNCLDHVSIGLIQAACPKTQATIGQQFNSWPDLMKSGHTLKLLIGLGDREFGHGVERQGNLLALVCLAVIAEKALRDPELISHPAAYFRAMIDRAEEEQLNLVKSLHGLSSKAVR